MTDHETPDTGGKQSAENGASEAYIRLVYNTPELHGSYCPCVDCERIAGPLPEWIHEVGKKGWRR